MNDNHKKVNGMPELRLELHVKKAWWLIPRIRLHTLWRLLQRKEPDSKVIGKLCDKGLIVELVNK